MKTRIDPLDADKAASRRDFGAVQRKYGHSADVAYRNGGPAWRDERRKHMVRIMKVLHECEMLDRRELPTWHHDAPVWRYRVTLRAK